MQSKKYTSGFCSSCHKNVPHRRWIANPIVLMFDMMTIGVVRLFRVGPWYCVHCDNKKIWLPFRNSRAIDYRSAALQNETPPTKTRQPTPLPAPSTPAATAAVDNTAAPAPAPAQAELEPAEPVGNFIKTESSLLMKSTRLNRYSEKYRDAVVRRILSGATSIKMVREEKQLSESEVTDWISDLFARQQQKLDALERFKKSISAATQLEERFEASNSDGQTVAGQVRPR